MLRATYVCAYIRAHCFSFCVKIDLLATVRRTEIGALGAGGGVSRCKVEWLRVARWEKLFFGSYCTINDIYFMCFDSIKDLLRQSNSLHID